MRRNNPGIRASAALVAQRPRGEQKYSTSEFLDLVELHHGLALLSIDIDGRSDCL